MTDHFARPHRAASSERVAELHRLCDDDYAKGQQQRALARPIPSYAPAPSLAVGVQAPEPTDLDVAINVAQRMLGVYGTVTNGDYAYAHGSLAESLRLVLRALGAEPVTARPADTDPPAHRCPAAHRDDPTPCDGPAVVTVLDAHNAGVEACEHHGARLLASLEGGRVYALPHAPDGAAIRVFKGASTTRPFTWVDGPRTHPSQLSRAENQRRGESQ